MEEITSLLQHLITAREAAANARARKAELTRKFEASPAYISAISAIHQADEQTIQLEEQVRTWGRAAFAATGKKEPAPGIKIRMITHYDYSMPVALDWARANLQEALSLNTKFFEEYVKGVASTKPVPCVSIVQEAQVTIAKNLAVEPLKAEEVPF